MKKTILVPVERKMLNDHPQFNYIEKHLIEKYNGEVTIITLDEQTHDNCLQAVNFSGVYLEFVINQDHDICKAAVKQDGNAIQFVDEKLLTKELQLLAIEQEPQSIRFISNPSEELCIKAVKQNGLVIRFIDKQTYNICVEAVKNNPSALEFCREIYMTESLILEAVKKDPFTIRFLYDEELTTKIFKTAIELNPECITVISNLSLITIIEAFKINPSVVMYISDKWRNALYQYIDHLNI